MRGPFGPVFAMGAPPGMLNSILSYLYSQVFLLAGLIVLWHVLLFICWAIDNHVNKCYYLTMKRDAPRLTIEIDEKLRKQFKKLAVLNDTTMADLLREFISNYVRDSR